MKAKIKTPTRGRGVRRKYKSSNASIIGHFEPEGKPSGYRKLINFCISGDYEAAKEYIAKAGYSGVLADFLLGNAELDAKLEILAAVMPVGVGDA